MKYNSVAKQPCDRGLNHSLLAYDKLSLVLLPNSLFRARRFVSPAEISSAVAGSLFAYRYVLASLMVVTCIKVSWIPLIQTRFRRNQNFAFRF